MIYSMKLWQKIFTISLLTSIFLFALCGLILTVSGHKLNLDYAKNQFNTTINRISDEFYKDNLESFLSNEDTVCNLREQKNIYVTVSENENILFGNLPVERQTSKYDLSERQSKELIYIEFLGDNHFYSSELFIEHENKIYKIILSQDISYIFNQCNQQLNILFVLCFVLSAIAAIIMLFTSKMLTTPIKQMNEAVSRISENHYSYCLEVENDDELNLLCENINKMSKAVERNITNYKFAINNFTHEVKTPLTSIIGYAEILNSPLFCDERKQEAAEYIQKESKRLNSLVTKIISFLTIRTESAEMKDLYLTDILEMACLSVKLQAEIKKITIDLPSTQGIHIYGDEELLVVLIVNLLDNAIKASTDNSQISIDFIAEDFIVKSLQIIDHGIGIPNDEIENITEVFYMVDKARSRSQNGLGLGLSICTEIIKAHGMTMDIQSIVGKGTIITLNFKPIKLI